MSQSRGGHPEFRFSGSSRVPAPVPCRRGKTGRDDCGLSTMTKSGKVFALLLLLGVCMACASSGMPFLVTTAPDLPTPVVPLSVLPASAELLPPTPSGPRVILQRLKITYLGLDGHKLIGSGCPGRDGLGSLENYHFVIDGVDIDRSVRRILVT